MPDKYSDPSLYCTYSVSKKKKKEKEKGTILKDQPSILATLAAIQPQKQITKHGHSTIQTVT